MQILVVDDDQLAGEMVSAVLQELGPVDVSHG